MRNKKVYTEKVINNFVNAETGEVLSTDEQIKNHSITVPTKDNFAFMYAAVLGVIKDLSGRDIKVLTYCALHASVETNEMHLNKHVTEKIAESFESSYASIKNSIAALTNKNILISLGGGSYTINPKYYWKGTRVGRNKVLKYVLTLEYNEQSENTETEAEG